MTRNYHKNLKLAVLYSVLLVFLFLGYKDAAAQVPNGPSDVYVNKSNNTLVVRKPGATAQTFVIKGVSWSPATKAPAQGPNPLNPAESVQYGFFFDWDGRNPQGHEVLQYWTKNQLSQYYLIDLPLIKQMNANTVRLYNPVGSNVEDFNTAASQTRTVLDECYRNGIMVVMTVAGSKDDLEEQFYIYKDKLAAENHFVPSGYMGDYGDLILDDAALNPKTGQNCTKITYSARKSQGQGWAGIYWQEPANNWGTVSNAGYNLTGAKRLTFWARGEKGGEFITVKIGGITGTYGDSGSIARGITLSNAWQQYTIDLTGINLSRIIGGFSFTVSLAAQAFYLDDIRYEGLDIFCQTNERRYEKIVNQFKNHPAVLMWSLGNEWNLNLLYGSWAFDEAAAAVNLAAQKIKALDLHHPVSSVLGDVFYYNPVNNGCPSYPVWTVKEALLRCPLVDVWGLNVYRGSSFTDLFTQWKQQWSLMGQLAKPFYISEFGIDSFHSTQYTRSGTCSNTADNVVGYENQQIQADTDAGLWREIKTHLSSIMAGELCLGGLIHEFNDEIWKVGNYGVGLGGLVDYTQSPGNHCYDDYNAEGFILEGGSPDNIFNEEYFGLVNANRGPKLAYERIKQEWIEPTIRPSATNIALTIYKDYTSPTGLIQANAFTITNTSAVVTGWQLYNNQDATFTPPGGLPVKVPVQGFGFYESSGGLGANQSILIHAYINNTKEPGLYKGSYLLQEIRNGITINVATITYSLTVKVDSTPPIIPVVTDGGVSTTSLSILTARWSCSDPESGIAEYQYRITQDSTAGAIVKDWTFAGTASYITVSGLSLQYGKRYYFAVKAKNKAGLFSPIGYSDGMMVTAIKPSAATTSLTIFKDYTSPSGLTLANAFTITNTSAVATGWQLYNNQDGTYAPPGGASIKVPVQGFGFYESSGGLGSNQVIQIHAYINNNKALGLYKGSYMLQELRNGIAINVATITYSLTIKTDSTPPTTAPVVTDGGVTTTSLIALTARWSCSDPESGIGEYQYRITQDSTAGAMIKDWTSAGTAYLLTVTGLSLTPGKTYYFAVKAKNKAGLFSPIGYSDGISVIPLPAAPISLTAAGASISQITLRWQDNATNEVGFKIERATSLIGSFTQIAIVGANITTYTNSSLTRGVTYFYRVRAYNAVGNSGYSNTAYGRTL